MGDFIQKSNGIEYILSVFISFGLNRRVQHGQNTTDGTNWTEVSDTAFGNWPNNINAITWVNGRFVAGGVSGKIAYWIPPSN